MSKNGEAVMEWRPHPRQEEFLAIPDSVFEAFYGGAAGGGKDLGVFTSILTPTGFKVMGDIVVGDKVFNDLGQPCNVVAISDIMHNPCYKLTFDDGSSIVAGTDHLWYVFSNADRQALTRRTEEFAEARRKKRGHNLERKLCKRGAIRGPRPDLALRNTLRAGVKLPPPEGQVLTTAQIASDFNIRGRTNYSIPVARAVEFGSQWTPIHPYVLGVWLGDGNSNAGTLTTTDVEILGHILNLGYTITPRADEIQYGILDIQPYLRALNLLNNKHIPERYKFSSYEQRLQLIQGLMDTDGTCYDNGEVEITLTNRRLIEDIAFVLRTLGQRGFNVIEGDATIDGRFISKKYRIKFKPTIRCFQLTCKACKQSFDNRTTKDWIYIKNVEPVETCPTKCIQVDSSSKMYLAGERLVPTHNSELLLWLPIVRGFHQHPRFKGLLLRRTFPELENSLILRSNEFYHKTGATYNTQKRRWTWPNGAILQFGYMDLDRDARNYDTTEFNYIGFDELTSFSEFQYRYVTFSRCRSATNLPAIVRSASNPGNIGHGWVRKRFVEPAPPKTIMVEMMPGASGPRPIKRIFIPAKLTDNPTLLREDPTYINRLMMLPEAERRAKLDGDWYTFSGQSFEDFRSEPLPSEPINARHVIPPFEIPKWWPSILAIDWGFAAMTWAGWGAVSPDQRVYVYREYAATRTKISTWASDIARLSQDDYIVDVVLDPSAWADRGTDETIMQQFCTYSRFNPRKADNDRVGGKSLVREFLRWKPKPPRFVPAEGYDEEIAQRILRTSGPERYAAYRELFAPEPVETNLPRLQIFENCTELIKALPLCIDNERHPEDVQEFNGDDPYDGLRYLLKGVDYFTSRSAKTAEILAARDKINREFAVTADTTSFYRKMEALERKQAVPVHLPLFHHKRRGAHVAF